MPATHNPRSHVSRVDAVAAEVLEGHDGDKEDLKSAHVEYSAVA